MVMGGTTCMAIMVNYGEADDDDDKGIHGPGSLADMADFGQASENDDDDDKNYMYMIATVVHKYGNRGQFIRGLRDWRWVWRGT